MVVNMEKEEVEELVDMTINRWFNLSEKFINELEGTKLGDIIRKLKEFRREYDLDLYDIEAITKLCFGEQEGDFILAVYLKSIEKP